MKNLGMIRKFGSHRGGNFAMMFSMLLLPILGGVALAVDYTNLTRYRGDLQNASDAAVLYAARQRQVTGKMPTTQDIKDFLAANFQGDLKSASVNIVDGQIVVDAATTPELFFLPALTSSVSDVAVRSAAPIATNTIMEVALALDTTYSMTADGKIDGLKAAATDFVNQMMATSGPSNSVKIGVVPFSNYVNVGMWNRNEPWLDVPADSQETVAAYCETKAEVLGYENCRNETYYADGVPYDAYICDPIYGEQKEICYPEAVRDVKWWGCVGDRASPYTLTDNVPNQRFPGMMDSWNMLDWSCPTPIQPLTNEKPQIQAAIDGLTPRGETYIVDGVTWGTKVLSHQAPYTEGVNPSSTSATVKKVLVLMSDGDNTMSSQLPGYHGHWSNDAALANSWTKEACANARKDDVEIYSISFGKEVSANGKDVLAGCASRPENFYDAANSSKLAEAFKDIANKLTKIRLTQ